MLHLLQQLSDAGRVLSFQHTMTLHPCYWCAAETLCEHQSSKCRGKPQECYMRQATFHVVCSYQVSMYVGFGGFEDAGGGDPPAASPAS